MDTENQQANDPFWKNLFRKKADKVEVMTRLWLATPLFSGIPARVCRQLVSRMQPRRYKPGEVIFNAGELGAGAVLIVSGKVSVQSGGTVLATLNQGDFFGEVALVNDDPRTADALAETDCELMFLMRQEIEEWVRCAPKFGVIFMSNIAHILAARLSRVNQMATDKSDN